MLLRHAIASPTTAIMQASREQSRTQDVVHGDERDQRNTKRIGGRIQGL